MVWMGERFHVLILGSRRVGKSALLEQLARSSFKEEVDIQLAKMEETVTVQCCVDQKSLRVDVTDTAYNPEEEMTSVLSEQLCRLADGCLLMYSVADRDSFAQVQQLHKLLLRVKSSSHWPCVLLGNKRDCISSFRQVPTRDGEALADMLGVPYREVSCKSKDDVEGALHQLIREIRSTVSCEQVFERQSQKKPSKTQHTNCTIS